MDTTSNISEGYDIMEKLVLKEVKFPKKNIIIECPSCGKYQHIDLVNTAPYNQVGGNYKILLSCSNLECGRQVLSEISYDEFLGRRLGIKTFRPAIGGEGCCGGKPYGGQGE